jgi:2-polyprenyl-3-methyl-5-hydroxy-6-metoxy-1,4-benzoquinol methylase
MDEILRQAWTQQITEADLDDHMHQVGQAAANAELLQAMLIANARETLSELLIVGGGTAQFLDYISADCLAPYRLTFSDINPEFLQRAKRRFDHADVLEVQFVVDDIEDTRLSGPYDIAVVILVLEHIDWRQGLRNIQHLAPRQLHIVIQCNPEGLTEAVSHQRELNASMKVFAANAHPALLSPDELIEFLRMLGYRLTWQQARRVLDGKSMLGLSFNRQ